MALSIVKPERTLLDNGLAVVVCPRAHLSRTHVTLLFGVASRHESQENNGITHALEHMVFRGTESFKDATALNAAAEDMGGYLEGATYRDHLVFETACHPSALGKAIQILSEVVQSPRFMNMDTERAILREEILEGLDAEGRVVDIDNVAHRAIFGDHGLGAPIEGTLANLERVNTQALEAHRQQYLVASNAVVSVAGPVQSDAVLRQIRRHFGSLPTGVPPVVHVPPVPHAEPRLRYVRDTSNQVAMRLTFRTPPIFSEDHAAVVLLARVLTDGLASRMYAELVDRQGLAYALQGGLTAYSDCTLFEFDVAIGPDRAVEVLRGLLDFISAARRFRYTDAEIHRARKRHGFEMGFMGDSPAELSHWYGHGLLFGVEKMSAQLPRRLQQLTGADLRRVAQQIFRREGMVLTAVGELGRGQWKRIQDTVAGWVP